MSKAVDALEILIEGKRQELVDYMLEYGDIISDYLNIYKKLVALEEQRDEILENEKR